MIDLSKITLVIIDDYNDEPTKNNIRYIINEGAKAFALDNIIFGDVVEVTPFGNYPNYEFRGGQREYSRFCVKELPFLIKTEYYLIQQWDGFIVNPNKWNDEFYSYEYLGGGHTLQCGGFSLRNTEVMRYISENSDEMVCENEFEDNYYSRFFNDKHPSPLNCVFKKPYVNLEDTFVENSATEKFCSFLNPNKNSFGFHFYETEFDYLEYYWMINKFNKRELLRIRDYIIKRKERWL